MKILIAHPLDYLFNWGGAHKCDRALARGLAALGHPCRLFALAGIAAHRADKKAMSQDEVLSELRQRGAEIVSVDERKIVAFDQGVELHLMRGRRDLRDHFVAQIEDFAPDWTLISEDNERELVKVGVEEGCRNLVYIAHSPVTLPFGRDAALVDDKQTEMMCHLAGVIAVSDYVGDEVRQGLPHLQPQTLHFPVYGDGSFPHLGHFDNPFVTIINPSAIKGQKVFLELAERLPHISFAAVVTWAGTSEERQRLEAVSNIELLPAVDDIDLLFRKTRALLVPSLWGEAFGLVVVEAMLRGVPVLASAYGGLPQAKLGVDYNLPVNPITTYRPNPVGAPIPIVPEQDVTPWADALEELLGDPERHAALSDRSREAALGFHGRLSCQTFVDYLDQLELAPPFSNTRTSKRRQLELSDAARALLARKLRQKKQAEKAELAPS